MMQALKKGARAMLGAMPRSAADATVAYLGGIGRGLAGRHISKLHPSVQAKRFADDGNHCFFGYYDITPFDRKGQRLLACQRPVTARNRAAGTPLELGTFDPCEPSSNFQPFTKTTTWCWQQGCRLQWLERLGPDCVIYNRSVAGRHGAAIMDITSGTVVRELPVPIYSVHPQSVMAISLNFARLQRLRPGYGYDDLDDPSEGLPAPDDDGLWRIDLETGESSLLFTLAQAAALDPQASMRCAQHYFNHVCWNPAGSRFLVFHLWQDGNRRYGRALTLDGRSGAAFPLTNGSHVSHYCWLDNETILLTSTHDDTGTGFHVYRDGQGRIDAWAGDELPVDGHPSLSPQGRWIVSDTLPNLYRERTLFLYDIITRRRIDVGSFYTPPALRGELRCDLHPRWNREGTVVSIDASHTGERTMMTLDVSDLCRAESAGA